MDKRDLPTIELMRDSDWKEVFTYAGGGEVATGEIADPPSLCEGAECTVDTFTLDDVAEVLAVSEGENDGPAWMTIAKLKDGRYAYIEAGCDYTGWDCRADGSVTVSHDLANLWTFGTTQEARERFLADDRTSGAVKSLR